MLNGHFEITAAFAFQFFQEVLQKLFDVDDT